MPGWKELDGGVNVDGGKLVGDGADGVPLVLGRENDEPGVVVGAVELLGRPTVVDCSFAVGNCVGVGREFDVEPLVPRGSNDPVFRLGDGWVLDSDLMPSPKNFVVPSEILRMSCSLQSTMARKV